MSDVFFSFYKQGNKIHPQVALLVDIYSRAVVDLVLTTFDICCKLNINKK